MGSYLEINDTLRIDRAQGFPSELDLEKHKVTPFNAKDFEDRIFEFKNKPNPRIYPLFPIRVFFVEEVNGKWLYWGRVQILEQSIDGQAKTTSGKFKITKIYTYEEMQLAHDMIDGNDETNFFKDKL